MHSVEFLQAVNGEETSSVDGKFLHSKYNPLREAQTFVSSIQCTYKPSSILILEPGLSYCGRFLKERFPDAKLYALHYTKDFLKNDSVWDRVFFPDSDIFFSLGEEELCSCLTLSWPPSDKIFTEESSIVWKNVKEAVLKARDVLYTRSYFSKRWLKNSIIFAARIKNPLVIKKRGKCDIIIAASGPSLKSSIPFIKKFRESFFLISLSSALMPLVKNGIMPDLVLSSDGGYWAKRHLDFAGLNLSEPTGLKFALCCEGAFPARILEKNQVLPLAYPDSLGRNFLEAAGIKDFEAQRNGTVSGTAAIFALNLTEGNVYFCGLDQAATKGFQHCQPNALEELNCAKDFRLSTKESRTSSSRFNSDGSLKIYREWFSSQGGDFSTRVKRLSDNYDFAFGLGKIQDVNWQYFEQKQCRGDFPLIEKAEIDGKAARRNEKIKECLDSLCESQAVQKELFPLEKILYGRSLDEYKKAKILNEISKKTRDFLRQAKRIF